MFGVSQLLVFWKKWIIKQGYIKLNKHDSNERWSLWKVFIVFQLHLSMNKWDPVCLNVQIDW